MDDTKPGGRPTLFHEYHQYEPDIGLETLWFYTAYDPWGPLDPHDDPAATKLVGSTGPAECGTVAKGVKLVLQRLGLDIDERHGADD